MKKLKIALLSIATLGLFSCSQNEMDNIIPKEDETKYKVSVNTGDLDIDITPQSGQALYNKVTSIQYLVYNGNTYVQSFKQERQNHTVDNYGVFDLELATGNYSIIAVANTSESVFSLIGNGNTMNATFARFPWSQGVSQEETFYAKNDFTVTGDISITITLKRKSCKILLELTDELDNRVKEFKITVPNYYQQRTINGLAESSDNEDIFYSKVPTGNEYDNPYTTSFMIVGTKGNNANATTRQINVRALDADGNTLKNLVAYNVPLADNTIIKLRGALNLPAEGNDGNDTEIDEVWEPVIIERELVDLPFSK